MIPGLKVIGLFGIEHEEYLIGRDEVVEEEGEDVSSCGVGSGRVVGVVLARTVTVHFLLKCNIEVID